MAGAWEIERRFLVRIAPDRRERLETRARDGRVETWHLRQGYVRRSQPSLRIRSGEPRGPVLSCKTGRGIRRREVEVVVPPEMADLLFEAAEDRVLSKTRYVLGRWDLDIFEDDLEGLAVLEIELESEEESLPEWPHGIEVLHEVTHVIDFTSNGLASLTSDQRTALARGIVEEPATDPALHLDRVANP